MTYFWEKDWHPTEKKKDYEITHIVVSPHTTIYAPTKKSLRIDFYEKGSTYPCHKEYMSVAPERRSTNLWYNLKKLAQWLPDVFATKDLSAMKDGMIAANEDITADHLNMLFRQFFTRYRTCMIHLEEDTTIESPRDDFSPRKVYLKIKGAFDVSAVEEKATVEDFDDELPNELPNELPF